MARILFIPAYFGLPSHFVPLVKLYQRLSNTKHEMSFLLPNLSAAEISAQRAKGFSDKSKFYYSQQFLSSFDIPVLDMRQHFSVISVLTACKKFAPHLVIDDSSLTVALARQARAFRRIAVVRHGVFCGSSEGEVFAHSLQNFVDTLRTPPAFPFSLPESIDGYFEADAHVIPATRSLEPIPGLPLEGKRAFYAGPLVLDAHEEQIFHSDALATFLQANSRRRIAYVTFGSDASKDPHSKIWELMRELLRREFVIITNMKLAGELDDSSQPLDDSCYFYSDAVPMHYVCARSSLVVHVCGSATYHYPILHGKPAITIGTRCRDREGVARTLCSRGLAHHIPAPQEAPKFSEMCSDALDLFSTGRFPFDESLRERLDAARAEIAATSAQFSMEDAVEASLAAPSPSSNRIPRALPGRQ